MADSLDVERRADPEGVERILRSLPEWFGIEDAIQNYVAKASTLDSYVAIRDDMTVGVALVDRHFPESAELALIAVHADHRGSGAGSRLVRAIESALRTDGCTLLEVHTVGPSYDDANYAQTRAFYRVMGFAPMHEFANLDWDGPTLVMVKRL